MPTKAKPKKNLSALKRARQSAKGNIRNKAIRTTIKTLIKKVESAISSGNKEDAGSALREVIRALNKAASKGVIHKNNASRKISNLTKKVNPVRNSGAF